MALQISFDDQFGRSNPDSYWYWTGMGFDVTQNTATLVFTGYASLQACLDGKYPLATKQVTVTGAEFAALVEQFAPTLSPIAYQLAQNDPFFSNAEVV